MFKTEVLDQDPDPLCHERLDLATLAKQFRLVWGRVAILVL